MLTHGCKSSSISIRGHFFTWVKTVTVHSNVSLMPVEFKPWSHVHSPYPRFTHSFHSTSWVFSKPSLSHLPTNNPSSTSSPPKPSSTLQNKKSSALSSPFSDAVFSATSERSLALLPLLAPFQAPIRFAFAYGSAAFAQSKENSSESSKPVMLDLIFGVTHPHHWHSINLHQNPHHYSCLAGLGSSMLAWVQEFSAGVYFNPYVNLNGTIVKYGVVSIDRLSKDLTEWDTFYLAGRMQKPLQILRHDSRISLCQSENLIHALSLAFLLLSPFTHPLAYTDVYRTIAGLSYLHDFRMHVKGMEQPQKIEKIVNHQESYFQAIYQPYFKSHFKPYIKWNTNTHLQLHDDIETKKQLLTMLPLGFLKKWNGFTTVDELAARSDILLILNGCLRSTVAHVALKQSIKGLFTAGLVKSFQYGKEKFRKSKVK